MKKIQILDRYSAKVLFEYECKDNTILKTLENANLENANLENANLYNANLYNEFLLKIKHRFQIIPELGQFIAWKKAGGLVIKLQIPARAKRTCNLKNRKCRAEFVKVIAIESIYGEKTDVKRVNEVGKITKADKFDDDMRKDCTNGIHFFISRQEAKNW